MSNHPNVFESLAGNIQDYVETRLNLFKLKLVDKSSDVASSIVALLPAIAIFLLVFFLFNIGIALLIGDLIGKAYLGFLILTGFYLITGLVLFSMRKKVFKSPFADILIRKFLKNKEL